MSKYVPVAIRSYYRNWNIYKKNPNWYWAQLENYFRYNEVDYFRWHVSGDIPDQNYLNHMIRIAKLNPNTRFMAMTKNYDLDFSNLPQNLTILLSAWPGYPLPNKRKMRVVWMQDGTEDRVPADAYECRGHCRNCLVCWEGKKDVVIREH